MSYFLAQTFRPQVGQVGEYQVWVPEDRPPGNTASGKKTLYVKLRIGYIRRLINILSKGGSYRVCGICFPFGVVNRKLGDSA